MTEWTAETAEWYAERYGEYATNRLAIDHIEFAPDATIVDIGCGTAAALRHLSDRVPDGVLIGIDPVPRMIEIAADRLADHPAADRIELVVAHAHELPLDDGVADVALAFDSYDHWGDQKAAGLMEVKRILAENGRFVVVKDSGTPGAGQAKRQFVDELEAAGFGIVSERQIVDPDATFTLWIAVPGPGG